IKKRVRASRVDKVPIEGGPTEESVQSRNEAAADVREPDKGVKEGDSPDATALESPEKEDVQRENIGSTNVPVPEKGPGKGDAQPLDDEVT
ncbi:MAG: hypothetical protein KAX31_05605, partial [Thermoplasmata archaeon]|nr:hypothetical protein [Thermoplasmata archaeon]